MGRRPGVSNADPNAKDKFADLDADFKDAISGSSPEEIYKRIAELAGEKDELEEARANDQDLNTKKEEYKCADEPYKLGIKEFKLKIKFALRVLGDKGKI